MSLLLSPSRQAHPVPRLLCQGHHDPHVSGSHPPSSRQQAVGHAWSCVPASLDAPLDSSMAAALPLPPDLSSGLLHPHSLPWWPQPGLGPPGTIWTLSRLISVHPLHLSARVCGADRRLNVSKPNSGGVPSGPPQFHPSASRAAAPSSLLTQKSGLILDFSLSHTWPSFSKSCWLYLQNVSLI